MPKPTLLQTLFNQPSQSYQFPPEKHYYSTKHDIQRRASHGHFSPAISPSSAPLSSSASLRHSVLSHSALDDSLYSSRSSSHSDVRTASLIPPDPVNVRASTHTRSASLSIASSHSLSIQPSSSSHFIAQGSASKPFDSHFDSSDMNFRFPAPPIPEDDTDDDHTDIFYTPRSSLYSSPRTSRASSSALTEPKVTFHNQSVPKPNASSSNGVPPLSPSISRSSSATSASSSSSDLGSLLSTTTQATTSTRPTSPLNSDHSNKEPRSANGDVQTITVSKSHHNAEASSSRSKLNTRPRGVPATAGHRRTRSQAENGRFASTDRDWAENVRWLSANTPAVSSSQRKTKKLQGQREAIAPSTNIRRNASSSIAPSFPPLAKSAELRERARNSRGSRGSRGRGRMSALLEEDESDISEPTSGASSSEHSRPPSPAPQLPPVDQNKVTTTKVTIIPTPTPDPSTEPVMRRRSVSAHSRSDSQQNRFGTVLTAEPEELDELTDLDHPDARLRAYARSNENQRKSYRRLSRSLSLTQADPRAYASTLPTHSLPTPTSPSSTPASGYTSLTLPHATPSSSNKRRPPDSGKVDLPRSGAAQSSMATIEIIRGAAYVQTSTSNSAGREKRRRHLSFSLKFFDASKKLRSRSKEKESATPAYLLDALPLPVAFTAHLSPPTYVPASHVLVKVFAVGLDSLDSLLVKHKLDVSGGSGKASKAVGYIPGRSLVGRVVQCGWDVSSDVCRKSDWVIALLDIRKSGALSEFVVVERHRLHRAPQPQFLAQPIPTPHRRQVHSRSMSVPIRSSKSPYTGMSSLGIDELALLPLCALPAHRAVRTFNEVLSSQLSRAKRAHGRLRAFITNGHDGVGEITVQLLRQRNVAICVQVPQSLSPIPIVTVGENGAASRSPRSQQKAASSEDFDLLEARLQAWGVEEIHIGDPLVVVERLAAEKQSFDLFLDTVGGLEIWEAAQRLLLTEPEAIPLTPSEETPLDSPQRQRIDKHGVSHAHFTTLVGDHPTRPFPSAQDNIRSGFRSLRRAMSTTRPNPSSGSTSFASNSTASSSTIVVDRDNADQGASQRKAKRTSKRTVGYAFVSPIADVDFQGEDINDSLSAILAMVEKGWIRPWIGDSEDDAKSKVVNFEKAPEVFRRNANGPVGMLADGGTCIVKVAG